MSLSSTPTLIPTPTPSSTPTVYSIDLADPHEVEMVTYGVSGLFVLSAMIISTIHIYQHLSNWTVPTQQRYVVRIVLMVPIYSADSWLSLRFHEWSLFFDMVRDCYEAYVLYQFFALLVSYIESGGGGVRGGSGGDDGEERLKRRLSRKAPMSHPCPLCCLPLIQPGPFFLVVTKQFILQYVLVKPLMAVVAVVLHVAGLYHEGSFTPLSGYLYVTIITNISVTLSMYFLVLFYLVTEKELEPYKPVAKFFCIKSILFFSFWQSVFIGALSFFDVIPQIGNWKKEQVGNGLQDFVICIEMFILSVAHIFVFSSRSYMRSLPRLVFRSDQEGFGGDGDGGGGGGGGSLVSSAEAVVGGGVAYLQEEISAFKGSATNFRSVVDQQDMLRDIATVYNVNHIKTAKKQQRRWRRGETTTSTSTTVVPAITATNGDDDDDSTSSSEALLEDDLATQEQDLLL